LLEEWEESFSVPIYKKGDKTDCSNYIGMSLLLTTYKILSNISCQGELHMHRKLVRTISVDFNPTVQLQTVHCAFVKYFRKNVIHEVSPSTSSQISAMKPTPAATNTFDVEDSSCSLNINASDGELRCIKSPNPPGILEQDTLYSRYCIWPQFLSLHQGKKYCMVGFRRRVGFVN